MWNYLADRWRERGGAIIIGVGLLFIIILAPLLILTSPAPTPPRPEPTPTPTLAPTATPLLPTPTPTLPARSVKLNPQHGIHAPIGGQWSDALRQALGAFRDSAGVSGAPGSVVALSVDMLAANNSAKVRLEQDLYFYQRQGAEIYVRLYPQRFPGGFSEAITDSRNTVSGTPQDAAEDIFRFVAGQHRRNGWHFTKIIPGNEPDLEWPNQVYNQNVLAWQSLSDPVKYFYINWFWAATYRAWQERVSLPDATLYRDVELYLPPLAQDAAPGDFQAAYNFYEYVGGQPRPVGNRYDLVREATELYARISWHNYFLPGRACQDVAALYFPDWLKKGLESGWPAVIGEAGWSPERFWTAATRDSRAVMVRFWQTLGLKWEKRLYEDERPQYYTADEVLDGARFEADLQNFIGGCATTGLKLKQAVAVAVWLAGSDGNFIAALGVEPGEKELIRRWLQAYAAFAR